jgi:maleate isomerase
MTGRAFEYGPAGTAGIGTPQANPTVEAEMAILMPPAVARVTARLTSAEADPANRLRAYLGNIEKFLTQFDRLKPDVFGFACTASSYLADDRDIVAAAEQRFGYPIVTATEAIAADLKRIAARRIALVSPYPPAITEAALRFWTKRGLAVTQIVPVATRSADTRSIYALTSRNARAALTRIVDLSVDAILLSGTGMPTLPLLADERTGPPVLSSNFCLAANLCDHLGIAMRDPALWRDRLRAATNHPTQGRQP